MADSSSPTPTSPTPGVTKIVKLGEETLMISKLENAATLPEGAYTVSKIIVSNAAGASGTQPTTRGCEMIQCQEFA